MGNDWSADSPGTGVNIGIGSPISFPFLDSNCSNCPENSSVGASIITSPRAIAAVLENVRRLFRPNMIQLSL